MPLYTPLKLLLLIAVQNARNIWDICTGDCLPASASVTVRCSDWILSSGEMYEEENYKFSRKRCLFVLATASVILSTAIQ